MKAAQVEQPRTSLDVLYGTGRDSQRKAKDALALQIHLNALGSLPESIRSAATGLVAVAAAGLLGLNLNDSIVNGWQKDHDLTTAARQTLAAPGSTKLVRLASQEITVSQQPHINIMVNDVSVDQVDLDLTLTFDISLLEAEISAGKLTALRSGHCEITASIGIQGAEPLTRQAQVELPLIISLGEGIRLLTEQEYHTGPVTY